MSYPVYYVPAGDVLPIFFSSYGKTNGESITLTGLAVTDIEIYKDGGTTQRASDAGYTLLDTDGIDFDGITGIHGFSIDTGDNTDASFYTVGAWFHVVVSAVTVDSQTVSFVAAAFRIMPAESVAGKPKVDVDAWLGTAAATPTVAGVPEVDVTHLLGTAWTAPATAGLPDVNVKQISTDATAADNAEAFFDGTGYAGTNNVIPTVTTTTTATNVTTVNGLAANVITATSIAADAITDAKVASDVTIASVTGAVGSVTAGVTVTTNNDKTGYALSSAGVQAIWDALTSALTTVGSVGALVVAIGARLGSWTGTGVNTVLGAFKAALSKTATLPSDIGGTFDPAADSTEAIRDRGDAAWITATGFSTLDAAGVRTAVGLGAANLDTQIGTLATAAELAKVPKSDGTSSWNATALAAINAEADTALTDYGALKPTTAGRTLDVTAGGTGGVDWGNVENPTTTVGLSGTTVKDSTDTTAALASVYQATILYIKDDSAAQDEWTAQFFKNGVPLTSGITSPTLTVTNSSGTVVINAASMTQIGSTGVYKYDATTTSRVSAGIAMIATVAATIDSGSRTFTLLKGRDTTA